MDVDAAIRALRADGPLASRREPLRLFGQFIGTWDLSVSFFNETGERVFQGPGEWMFSWVLDGRAIQDVIIYADPVDPSKNAVGERRIGTTLRYYDPTLDAWRMVWLGATSGTFLTLMARPQGKDILVESVDMDGSFLRWTFTEITPEQFRWIGMTSKDRTTWRMEQEMFGRRRASAG